MNPILNNILPDGAVIKYDNHIYQIGGYKQDSQKKTIYLVTSSIWGGTLGEIQDSDKLLLRDGEKRISRLEYRPDDKKT